MTVRKHAPTLYADRVYSIICYVNDKEKMVSIARSSIEPHRAHKQALQNAESHKRSNDSLSAQQEFLLSYSTEVRLLEENVQAEDTGERVEFHAQRLKAKGWIVTNLFQIRRSVKIMKVWEY